ncbi:putative transporter small subunit [Saccharospirillum sp.]
METLTLAAYVLVWPLISLAVLAVICVATWQDIRSAKRESRELV